MFVAEVFTADCRVELIDAFFSGNFPTLGSCDTLCFPTVALPSVSLSWATRGLQAWSKATGQQLTGCLVPRPQGTVTAPGQRRKMFKSVSYSY